ncbi:hypothetical protein Pcar_1280 [Syntrophotalea carbinolica DSM 2380]|uniref:Sulfotransferase domain-containing protein n=1 Tax=Syntrophotalea carbinolica (strain DSM 2380 / NBRC 103641 / GraBd1) TaxID=338963 RepID=Q3A528_SYNC1|nr:sulfotransferase domain-containing protein [Syntrophotalea carbinolica]ABA88529.1 hypothetical protein Pcar_1280 [Syntrophotalea carbinolica DSM 2380]
MLIVAIPKSASTSLVKTMGLLHGLPAQQKFFKDAPVPATTKLLHRYHSDIREFNSEQTDVFGDSGQFFKQHIPPTDNNLELVRGQKKVILLRDPREIIEAYYRASKKKIHKERDEFKNCTTVDEWHQAACDNGLFDDLQWFYDRWNSEAKKHAEENLVIDYSSLIADSEFVINEIEKFFNLSISENVSLSKERFSRTFSFSDVFSALKRIIVRKK